MAILFQKYFNTLFRVSSFIIKNEDRTFIHAHSPRSDRSESQVTGAVVWDLENQYPILCFGTRQRPLCKEEFLNHPYALTPAVLVEYRMCSGIQAVNLEISSDVECTLQDQLNHTINNMYFFQHYILFLLFCKIHEQIRDFSCDHVP